MERWVGKVAVVTGASGGIGQSIVTGLTEAGMKVVGLARRTGKLEELAAKLAKLQPKGSFSFVKCDVEREEDIRDAFRKVDELFHRIDVLINNAGVLVAESLLDGSVSGMKTTLAVNAFAPAMCSMEAIKMMLKRNNFGHIINMNSQAGHNASAVTTPVGLYSASKYAVTGLCESLRAELKGKTSRIKITSISPGGVKTDMVVKAGVPADALDHVSLLNPDDVRDAVLYALGTPAHVHVHELTLASSEEIVRGDEPENF